MSVVTFNPQSNQTPDATLGGSAVSGITNTGHGSTSTNASANNGGFQNSVKSARWFGFQNQTGGQRLGTRLKLSWNANGSANASDDGVGGSGDGSSDFLIEYSTNGGSSWTTIVSDSASATSPGNGSDSFSNSNSADIALSVNQDLSQVQVRVRYDATASADVGSGNHGDGSVTATISNIRIEVTIADDSPIVLM
jgi:hypothetical protein